MFDVKLNCLWYIAIFENIELCANKWITVNIIIRVKKKYVKPFNSERKMSSGSFKTIIYKMCLEIIYLIYMYKKDLALNNLQ